MKSKVLISLLLLVFAVSVNAQSNDNFPKAGSKSKSDKESIFKYGLKFGYDMQPITVKPQEMLNQLKYGYQGGFFIQMGRSIYFQPEIYYASYTDTLSSVSGEKIQSFRAPLMFGLRFIDLGIVSAHLMGGPVFSASLSNLKAAMRLDEITKNWQVGVGVDILGFITADVRYTLLNGVELTDQYSHFNLESSFLNVTVGFKLK